jgi:hypothetical protein
MLTEWKRPKEVISTTEKIPLSAGCGNLHLTLGKEDDKLIEIRAVIGKNACCGYVLLDTIAKLMSVYLQSPEPRFKIVEKFKRQFMPDGKGNRITCGQPKGQKSCVEEISERILKELE